MPPPPSGVPGEGFDDDDDPTDDPVEFRPPLPPEDRIWRHPSEVAAAAAPARTPAGRRTVVLVAASALIGATLSVGVIAAFGGFEGGTRVVERQVAVQPVTSTARRDGIAAITDRTAPSVAGLHVQRGDERSSGTAFVLRSDGYLLTSAHLVDGADAIDVSIQNHPMTNADVVGVDLATDVAVLHVDDDDLEPAVLGSSSALRIGDDAIAMGHADGSLWNSSIDRSVVSALDQRLRAASGTILHGMILIDSTLPVDVAGGPLLDSGGAVVGVTSAIGGDGSHGVAIPIDVAVDAADQIIEHGRVRHAWLGIEGVDLAADLASEMGLSGGARVQDVVRDSPAAAAGFEIGDVVVAVDDRAVSTMSELIAALRAHRPGDIVIVQVRRGDGDVVVEAELTERDAP